MSAVTIDDAELASLRRDAGRWRALAQSVASSLQPFQDPGPDGWSVRVGPAEPSPGYWESRNFLDHAER